MSIIIICYPISFEDEKLPIYTYCVANAWV